MYIYMYTDKPWRLYDQKTITKVSYLTSEHGWYHNSIAGMKEKILSMRCKEPGYQKQSHIHPEQWPV